MAKNILPFFPGLQPLTPSSPSPFSQKNGEGEEGVRLFLKKMERGQRG